MTEHQINFLLQNFFSQNCTVPDWAGIAIILLTKSKCILPGSENPWKGGIGNFITVSPAPTEIIGCICLTFNKEQFFKSEIFKESKQNVLNLISEEILQLSTKEQEITQLC